MHDRIRELAEQATTIEVLSGRGFDKTQYTTHFSKEKFAELIVRECAELIDNKVTITAVQTYDEVFVARYDTKELCAKQIREHFGVEE